MVFAWITYRSRADRDRINAQVMKDECLSGVDMKTVPFDAGRMFWGGFEVLVET